MTTKRGEAIETEHETVEAILRPLLALTVPCPLCRGTGTREVMGHSTNPGSYVREGVSLVFCPPVAPDPRFDALRYPIFARDYASGPGVTQVLIDGHAWTIDASVGAIIEAAAAIGIYPLRMVLSAIEGVYEAAVFGSSFEGAKIPANKFQEAAARALVAAWRDEKAAQTRQAGERES